MLRKQLDENPRLRGELPGLALIHHPAQMDQLYPSFDLPALDRRARVSDLTILLIKPTRSACILFWIVI